MLGNNPTRPTCGRSAKDRFLSMTRMAAVCLFAVYAAFSEAPAIVASSQEEQVLSIPCVKALLNVPAILEIRLGLLEKEFSGDGMDLQHPEISSGPLQIQALASGSIHIANSLGATLILPAVASGLDLRIFGVNARAPGAYALLVRDPDIATVRDLAGLKVAGPRGTFLHQLLWSAMKREEMAPSSVELLSMPQPEALTALLSGRVDGALLAGPLVASAVNQGARVLVDGEGLIGGVSYLVTTRRVLKEHPDLAERLLKVRRAAVDYMTRFPAEAMQLASEESGLSEKEISLQTKDYDFSPDLRSSDGRDLEEVMGFLKANGLLDREIDLVALFGGSCEADREHP